MIKIIIVLIQGGIILLKEIANTVRGLSADIVEKANSGHPGMPIGCADIGSLLFGEIMDLDGSSPEWPDRDRFVLSAGHGSAFLYSFLHLSGFDLSMDDLKSFRQLNSRTPGHPEYGYTDGVETTTGPLGQGFANAVGMAVAEKMMASKYNKGQYNIVDHYTYTILGDGCMMEGISSEAASLAGHLGLGKLIAVYDDNSISIEGSTDITFTENVADRFKAYGWHVVEDVDGHDISDLRKAFKEAKENKERPSLIIAKTHIAYGSPNKQDSSSAHGAPLGEEEVRLLKEHFDLPADKKFYIPEAVKDFFEKRADEMNKKSSEWQEKFKSWAGENPELKEEWDKAFNLDIPSNLEEKIMEIDIKTPIATRKVSGAVLEETAESLTYLVGGSADLAPSNKTYLDKYGEIQNNDYSGRNFRFGVREHAMGAVVNGISLHRGLRPFAATFLVFSDYMRPAIRLAALMKQPVIYVFTHDSIYIGEDGPTHQPVEHVESLRLIPGLKVLRPADEEETKAAWMEAVENTDGPTALILTRQSLPHLEKYQGLDNFDQGAYFLSDPQDADIIIFASGSEVSLAAETAEKLQRENVKAAVMSVPEKTKFMNSEDKIDFPDVKLKVAIEAGVGSGWWKLVDKDGLIISVEDFGISGPGSEVGAALGFDSDQIVEKIKNRLK